MAARTLVSEKILEKACCALADWEEGATLDDCLDSLDIQEEHETDAKTIRSAVSSLLFEYFRHKKFVDSLIRRFARKGEVHREVRIVLQCVITQAFYQTGIAAESAANVAVDYAKRESGRARSAFVNAFLHTLLRAKEEGKTGEEPFLFPEELHKKHVAAFGKEKADEIASFFASDPFPCFRMREPLSAEELDKFGAKSVPSFPETPIPFPFFEISSVKEFFASRIQESGKVYLQDPATALCIALAKEVFPGGVLTGKVLDSCAAPGGKTLMLADLTADRGAKITACDRSKSRCALMNVNFKRAGTRIMVKHLAAQEASSFFPPENFDLVLADVPCSNTGVIRRRPDAPWRYTEKHLRELVLLQKEILSALAPLVKKGGFLLYSTCSIEEEEDFLQTKDFLETHKNFSPVSEKLLFPAAHHDGAYAALLKREE